MTDPSPIPLVLKYDDWPATDQSAWNTLFAKGLIFEDEGLLIHWSNGSRAKRMQSYGQWLSFLKRTQAGILDVKPSLRFTHQSVGLFLKDAEDRGALRSLPSLITDLFVLARVIDPSSDWSWLNHLAKRLKARTDTHSLAKRHPVTAQQIFGWSLARMEEVDALDITPLTRAIWFRQALMIGLLISRPIRRRTFMGIRLGKHLTELSDGFALRLKPEDIKDKRHHSYSIPNALAEPMRRYLDVHRLVLLQGKSFDDLWITQYGNVMTADGYARELPKITKKHLDVELRPHAFRHIAATSIAEVDPEHVGIIRDILGHATLDMAYKHYNRASQISSCNGLQSIVEDIRKNVPKIGRAKQRLSPPDNRSKP